MNIQEHLCLIVFALQLKQTWTWHQWLLRGLDPGIELLRRHILPFDIRQDRHIENPRKSVHLDCKDSYLPLSNISL